MQDLQSLQRHLGSLFVTAAFLDEFSSDLAFNIAMTIGTAAPSRQQFYGHTADAAHPMASVLFAAHDVCSQSYVTDEESLDNMLDAVRKQSDVVSECNNETDRALALADLERCFESAAEVARDALREVQGGFPVSGGDFTAWKQAQYERL